MRRGNSITRLVTCSLSLVGVCVCVFEHDVRSCASVFFARRPRTKLGGFVEHTHTTHFFLVFFLRHACAKHRWISHSSAAACDLSV